MRKKTPLRDFELTPLQKEALKLLGDEARHVLLYGGSRSGKSFLLVYALLVRALKAPGSRHAVLRLHGNAARQTIWLDTLPKVLRCAFPGVRYDNDRTDGLMRLGNGSEIWFAGLDESESPDRILGREFATLYFNECSELAYSPVSTALSRLAQKTALKNRAYFDCNPTGKSHWTYLLFVEKRDPVSHAPAAFPDDYRAMRLNPESNRANLPEDYIEKTLMGLPERDRRRFLEGRFCDDVEGALWSTALLEKCRADAAAPPRMARTVVGVDPAVCASPGADHTGIVVCGEGTDGRFYVLADRSCRARADVWVERAALAYREYNASKLICEVNNGGELLEHLFRHFDSHVNFRPVRAVRDKYARAEPVAALYERGLVRHAGRFPELEAEMCSYVPGRYAGSPDRMDALVWALDELSSSPSGSRWITA